MKKLIAVLIVGTFLFAAGDTVRDARAGNAYGHCKDKAQGSAKGHVCEPEGPTCADLCEQAWWGCSAGAGGDPDLQAVCDLSKVSCINACPL